MIILGTLSIVFDFIKHNILEIGSFMYLGTRNPNQLSPLQRANFKHWTLKEVLTSLPHPYRHRQTQQLKIKHRKI